MGSVEIDMKAHEAENTVPVTRRESRKQENRQSILKTAEEVFLEKGFSATTTDEIAERAGVTKKTLYSYFPSKVALYVNMFDDYLRQLSVEVIETSKRPEKADDLILMIFDALFDFTRRNEKFMRLYWMLDSDEFEGDLPKELIMHVHEHTRAMFKSVTGVVRKAQKDGLLIDVDPMLLSHLMSAINKGIFTHASKERRLEIADVSQEKLYELLKLILKGGLIRKKAQSTKSSTSK